MLLIEENIYYVLKSTYLLINLRLMDSEIFFQEEDGIFNQVNEY